MPNATTQSPRIYRCALCGALVHPATPEEKAAWCGRCHRAVPISVDGGDD